MKLTTIKKTSFVFIGLACLSCVTHAATVINIDFSENNVARNAHYTGTAAAPDTGTVWNVGAFRDGTLTDMVDSLGNVTTVDLVMNAANDFGDLDGANVGGTGAGDATLGATEAYDVMLDYMNVASNNKGSLTFSGLQANQDYDLYFYAYGDNVGQNSVIEINGVAQQTSDPTGLTTLTEGRHYVKFSSITSSALGEIFAEYGSPGAAWTTPIVDADANTNFGVMNGVQIVAVPELTSFAYVLAFGFFALIRRRFVSSRK